MNVSVYTSFTDFSPRQVRLERIIARIRDDRMRAAVSRIRETVAAGNDALVDTLKKALPNFTTSAVFDGRRLKENLISYNGIVQADADNVDEATMQLIERHARTDKHVVAGFRSPTGTGYKLFILTAAEMPAVHAAAFRTAASYVKATYHIDVDNTCKDITRCCFVSWDPDAFFRADAVPLPLIDGLSDTSDIGRAQKFLDRFYPVLRFVPPWKRWLVFMGGQWHAGKDGAEYRLIESVWLPELKEEKEALLDRIANDDYWDPTMAGEAWKGEDAPHHEEQGEQWKNDREKRKKGLKKAVEAMMAKYTNIDPLKKMLEVASMSTDVIIPPAMVDGDPMLVGVENGFVDLRTSAFAPYNADVVITKKMGVAYGASSRCPRWEQFMREILPNRRVRAFVAKAMGNCLTGNLNKGIMFLWGTGDNGKSVFLDVMFAIFGDYACRTSPQLLYKTKYIDEVPEHQKAELFGKRLAIGNEVAQDAKLNEAAVKEVTGESTTMGCRKWEHPFTFQQTAKIWIAGNHSPVVRGTDNAIWGRINKVEFPATFDKTQNTDIRDRLLEEAPGILNWLLNSARHAIAHGNRPPKEVILAVDEYRREEDMLVEFVEGYFLDGDFVEVVEVYDAYQKWCKEAGVEHPQTRRKLVRELRSRGFVYDRDKTGSKRGFRGKQMNPAAYHAESEAF